MFFFFSPSCVFIYFSSLCRGLLSRAPAGRRRRAADQRDPSARLGVAPFQAFGVFRGKEQSVDAAIVARPLHAHPESRFCQRDDGLRRAPRSPTPARPRRWDERDSQRKGFRMAGRGSSVEPRQRRPRLVGAQDGQDGGFFGRRRCRRRTKSAGSLATVGRIREGRDGKVGLLPRSTDSVQALKRNVQVDARREAELGAGATFDPFFAFHGR